MENEYELVAVRTLATRDGSNMRAAFKSRIVGAAPTTVLSFKYYEMFSMQCRFV